MQNPKAIFHCTLPKIVNMGLKIHEKKVFFFRLRIRCKIGMSVGFSREHLARKLRDLTESANSISTLSLWLLHHKKVFIFYSGVRLRGQLTKISFRKRSEYKYLFL